MLILADARLPREALDTLSSYGDLHTLSSQGVVYDSISGHPDIFLCQDGQNCIVAPNAPQRLFLSLHQHQINYKKGEKALGNSFPHSAAYNAVATPHYFIHHQQHSDSMLKKTQQHKQSIHIPQAYSRCNILPLSQQHFICSDKGIEKAMQQHGISIQYFKPESILLQGHKHGFLGGCMGVYQAKVFIVGSLDSYQEGAALRQHLLQHKMDIVELYQGPLVDGGGVFFF